MNRKRRIILKLSGEALAPRNGEAQCACFDPDRVRVAAEMVRDLTALVEVGVVLGGGNIWRGRFTRDMDPVNADQMGMLATIINALCLEDALTRLGVYARVFSPQEMNRFTTLYTARAADETLRAGGVALLSGGTGNPFFTTDTGAALRACELKADAIYKGTTVEGVYDCDPNQHACARLIPDLTYDECIERNIRVMDIAAFQMCREHHVPEIRVFSMDDLQNILRVARGEPLGSRIHA